MNEIDKLIDEFFNKAVNPVLYDNKDKIPETPNRMKILKLNVCLRVKDSNSNNNKDINSDNYDKDYDIDLQAEYLALLDKIDEAVVGVANVTETQKQKDTYSVYYSGNELFDTNINMPNLVEKAKRHNNGGDIAESLKIEIKEWLLKKNGHKRIAQLYYYKKNHKEYKEKKEEKAYREIVNEVIGKETDKYFTKATLRKVEKRTKEVVGCAIRASYDKLCDYKNIAEIYRFSEEEYVSYIDRLTNYHVCIEEEDRCQEGTYYSMVCNDAEDKEYIPLSDCYKFFLDTVKTIKSKVVGANYDYLNCSLDTYKRYFRGVFTVVAGFKKDTVDNLRQEVNKSDIIFSGIVRKLNEMIVLLMLMTKSDKDFYKKESYSRFIFINNASQFSVVKGVITIYEEIIRIRIEGHIGANSFISNNKLLAQEEIKIIESANVEIVNLLDKISDIENFQAK